MFFSADWRDLPSALLGESNNHSEEEDNSDMKRVKFLLRVFRPEYFLLSSYAFKCLLIHNCC